MLREIRWRKRIIIEGSGSPYLNENIVKVGDDQYLAQGLGEGVLTLKEVKQALVQVAVEAGIVEDNKKAKDAAEKQIHLRVMVEFDIEVKKK